MPEESTTSNLVELVRETVAAGTRRDFDAPMALYAPDAVRDMSNVGLGEFGGCVAIPGFLEDGFGSCADMRAAAERLAESRG